MTLENETLTITFTCAAHGTQTVDEDDVEGGDCCFQAWLKALEWDQVLDSLRSAILMSARCKADSDAGDWAGPAFVPMTAAELLESALRTFEESEEEWVQADIQVGIWRDEQAWS